jgi:hypothetical protein
LLRFEDGAEFVGEISWSAEDAAMPLAESRPGELCFLGNVVFVFGVGLRDGRGKPTGI